ncbi:LytR family transcriptional regulator [Sporolactobacillus sp. THM7-4]|nr:LytR family transcriptional regulator [Sporolactobacillus sp. THM7-4]
MVVSRQEHQKYNKRRKRMRIWLIALVTVLILASSAVAYGAYLTNKLKHVTDSANNELTRGDKSTLRQGKVDPVKDNFSILFMGIDKRKNEPSRSDALILATFNHDTKQVKMVSIPRDSRAQIIDPTHKHQYGYSKITHAHAYGDTNGGLGPDYTIATVENLFRVPVDYYVQIDFQAFVKIIDALGGIKMDVPVKLVTSNSTDQKGKNAIVLNPGVQTLNGEQALSLVRNRKSPGSGGDFGRGRRQMEMIKAIVKKSASLSSVTKYGSVIDSLHGHIETNLTFGQLLSLRNYAGSLSGIDTMQLKGTDDYIDGIYYYSLNNSYLQKVRTDLSNQLGITPSEVNANTTTQSDSGASGNTGGLYPAASGSSNNTK